MNEEMLQEVLRTGLDNISDDMPREDIVKTLTNRGISVGEGMIAMKSMWSNRFTDNDRLGIMTECYDIMLDRWFDESTSDEPDYEHMNEIVLVLTEIDRNRKSVVELVRIMSDKDKMHTELMDKILTDMDTDEIPRC